MTFALDMDFTSKKLIFLQRSVHKSRMMHDKGTEELESSALASGFMRCDSQAALPFVISSRK